LAGALGIPVILIPMGSPNMDDDKFKSSLGKAPQRSIVLMEDIDCAFQVVNKPENGMFGMRGQGITLSGFLNAIDGVSAQQGRMLFFTTNHKETLLESAMIRPGRIDMEFFMGNATKEGAGELFDRFFSLTTESNEIIAESRTAFLDLVEPHAHSYAALQGVLMQSRQDFTQTAANMRQWIAQEKATQQILDQENSARRLRQENANKTMMDMLASAIREQNQARLESSVPSSHTDTTEGSSDGSDGIVKSTIDESLAVNQ
jgi:chaperone BCS1